MVSWAKLGADRVTYYEHSVAAGKEHYYAGAGEAQGRYAGEGARLLGLTGELRDGELTRLASGLHPVSGERLREPAGAKAGTEIGAFDFTFSVPKSVSLLYASGDRELCARILDAHDRAVEASLRALEQEAAFVRRGRGGAIRERADGLVVASYRHRTSRAGDPQLHQHAIVANMARGPDSRWTALDSVRARDFKMALGAIHEAELRANIAALGLRWKPLDRKGLAELECIDRPLLREFSKRRAEIEQAALGSKESARAMAGAALSTRRVKREVDMPAIERAVADSIGAPQLAAIRDLTAMNHERAPVTVDYDWMAGPEGLTMMRNAFTRNDVIIAVARSASQGIHAGEILDHVERFLERGEVIELAGGRYTTQDLLNAEGARQQAQVGRIDERTGIATDRALRNGTGGLSLNNGQRAVVEAVFRSGRGVEIIESQAGTGKTFTADAIRAVAEENGSRVIGTAPTGRAARELESQAGIESYTVDSLLRKLDRGDLQLRWNDVVVADEMGMAGSRPSARLEQYATDAGAKLIEFRDTRQLQSVLAGGELQGVHEQLGGLALTEIVRQRDPEERRALGRMHAGDVDAYITHQERRGRVAYHATIEQAVAAYTRNVRQVGFDQVALVVPTNAMAQLANELVRIHRWDNGELGKEGVIGGLRLAEGDRVVFRLNDHRNGGKHLQVSNGDRGTVTRIHGLGAEVRLDSGVQRSVNRDYIEGGYLQIGYAGTVHTHQGQTVERTVVAGRADEMYAELAYVAASRARDTTDIYVISDNRRDTARSDIGPLSQEVVRDQREELIRTMSESRSEQLAVEQLPERRIELGIERDYSVN